MGCVLGQDGRSQSTQRREVAVGADQHKTRLTDIAQHAGLSTATVSRVINGKPGVSSTARRQVLAALDVLGYNRPERSSQRRQGLIGLIIPELTNPIFPAFAQAMEIELSHRGYTPLLCTQSPGGTTESEYLDVLMDHKVDGIIIVSGLNADSTASHQRYEELRAQGVPLAFINGFVEGIDATFVSHDDVGSVALAVRHLVSLGHTRIGLATGPRRFIPSQRKIDGFHAAMAQYCPTHSGESESDVALSLFTVEGGQAAAAGLIAQGCTGIICASDLMAIGAIRAARAVGKQVPEQISVVGFDDAPFNSYLDPGLTTIRQATSEMSHAVVSAILNEINGEPAARGEMLFQPELIVRGSTGTAPMSEELLGGRL